MFFFLLAYVRMAPCVHTFLSSLKAQALQAVYEMGNRRDTIFCSKTYNDQMGRCVTYGSRELLRSMQWDIASIDQLISNDVNAGLLFVKLKCWAKAGTLAPELVETLKYINKEGRCILGNFGCAPYEERYFFRCFGFSGPITTFLPCFFNTTHSLLLWTVVSR